MRDIPGYVDTRQQLLQLKSNQKGHWLGFAIAHHLNGNHALAVQILEAFEQTQEGVPDNEQYEQSEMVMYKAMILSEGGEPEQALELLQCHKVSLCVVMYYDVYHARSTAFKLPTSCLQAAYELPFSLPFTVAFAHQAFHSGIVCQSTSLQSTHKQCVYRHELHGTLL